MALLSKWYSAWTDEQRWELVQFVLLKLSDKDLHYIYSLLDPLIPRPPLPEVREDFTRVFPRSISLKILSYLDARSLCRAAQVSWYWRYLSEQNMLWKPKCLRYSWFLPIPSTQSNPLTIWKRHYVTCVSHMTWRLPQVDPLPIASSPSPPPSPCTEVPTPVNKSNASSKKRIRLRKNFRGSSIMQPIWRHPNRFPKELRSSDTFMSSLTKRRHLNLHQSKASNVSTVINEPLNKPKSDSNHGNSLDNDEKDSGTCHRPFVDIDALLKPELLEKLRLGDPKEETILVSTIRHPEKEDKRELAATLSRVQAVSPFPSLPPYYQERNLHEDYEREKSLEDNKMDIKDEKTEDDFIRGWRDDDFNTDSESDIY
ncbi:PREDICTED: F-box only protein 16-like isoform X2 [Amphimedon queenslandica]|nr:PREDICTED: F-box only protein 16-like isoform X2 [Amphimedon queenslandica]|eukprot:XP_019851705.1 PREDICTED: F-box only protein 16-like isoform X2 [Amphimedon queenslandica]